MQDRYLRTGIFLAPFHALGENPTLAIERDMELVEHLDRLNYHEAWIGEHHSGGFEIIACPEMFIAGAVQRTRNIRLGTGVVSLPYHHPFTLASRMMQLDHMARGRAMFGVGPGALIYDADKIGLKAADQRRRMAESLDCIMELMQGGTVNRKTDWFTLNEARLQLMPYTQPAMEMAVACSRSPVGAVASGKHGIGMLSIGGTSDEALLAHAKNWSIHEEAAAKAGKTPDRSKWRIVTFAHVAETREKARADMAYGLADFCRYFTDVATFPIIPPDVADPVEYLTSSGPRLHRHAGRLHPALRTAVAGLERRLRRRPAARPQLGGLGSDEAQLRADGALCPSALPAPVERAQGGELRRCQGQARDGRRGVRAGRAGRDREVRKGEGESLRRSRSLAALGMTGCSAITPSVTPSARGAFKPQ